MASRAGAHGNRAYVPHASSDSFHKGIVLLGSTLGQWLEPVSIMCYPVTEIMYMVGYSNMSYFIKCFQAEFGMTPKKFSEK